MPRPHRREAESGIHHVMNRGVDRQAIFFTDGDRIEFGRCLAAIHEEHGVVTLAYCLMGNHFHLLLRSPAGALSPAMHQLTSTYSHRVNMRRGRDGPLFRGRFHSIPVETDAYLLWVTRYIHRNPLDLPGVDAAADYRWSSYRTYLGRRPAPPFLDVRPVLDLVGGPRELAVLTEDPLRRPPVEGVRRLVECAIAVDDLDHPAEVPSRAHLARSVTVLLAARTSDPELRSQLDAALGHRSPRAAREAVRRAEVRLADDDAVGRVIAWVEQALTPRTVGAWHQP